MSFILNKKLFHVKHQQENLKGLIVFFNDECWELANIDQ